MSCSPAPARSTGFATPADGGSSVAQSGADVGRKLRHRQPGRFNHVGGHPGVSAAVGDHAHPMHGLGAVAEQRGGGVGELAGAGDAMDARRRGRPRR